MLEQEVKNGVSCPQKNLLSEGSPPRHTEITSRPVTVSPGTLHGGEATVCGLQQG